MTSALIGHKLASGGFVTTSQDQIKNIAKSKEDLLRKAIIELEHARNTGAATLTDMAHQAGTYW